MTANCITGQIHYLEREDAEAPILVYINTPGGDVVSGLAIYDALRSCGNPIVTIVQGRAHSAGLMILQAGDLRLAFPNSRMFYHEPLLESGVDSTDTLAEVQEIYAWSLERNTTIIRERAGMSKKKWKKHFLGRKTCANFTTKQALKCGLIDDTMTFPEKHPMPEILTNGK